MRDTKTALMIMAYIFIGGTICLILTVLLLPIGIGLIIPFLFIFSAIPFARKVYSSGRIPMNSWLSTVSYCDYRYAWDGHGIAVDRQYRRVHLASVFYQQPIYKSYPFEDVLQWSFEMPGAAHQTTNMNDFGHQFGTSVANMGHQSRAVENTGLYVSVRDTQYPVWFIKFQCPTVHNSHTQFELQKWMEILRQNINE